jgi:hypothetical protein
MPVVERLLSSLAGVSITTPDGRDSLTHSIVTVSSSQSYVMTNGQLPNLSWCQAPIWGPRPDFYYSQTVVGLLMWGTLSDETTGLLFTIAAIPRQHSFSRVQVP